MTEKQIIYLKGFAIIVMIQVVTVFSYWDALYNDFLMWDTEEYVVNNQHIKAINWENIQWMLTTFYATNWHPLTWLSHALDYALFGLNPWGHHLSSLIIHCLNTAWFFVIIWVLLNKIDNQENLTLSATHHKNLLIAGISAFLFSIHPQHVESVIWIAERKDVLCLFFILMTLLCYIFYTMAFTKKTAIYWYLLALLSFIAAVMSKPMAVTLPVILLLIDVYPLHRTKLTQPYPLSEPVEGNNKQNMITFSSTSSGNREEPVESNSHHTLPEPVEGNSLYKQLILEKIPFCVFSLISAILTVLAQHQDAAISTLTEASLQIRLLNACNSLIFYLSKLIFPIGLSPFYPFPTYRHFYDYYPSLIPAIAVLFITVICGYLWYQKRYYWLTTWLFYLITLLPVIGIIQVGSQSAADRYTYLPTLPIYLLIAVGMSKLYYQRTITKILQISLIVSSLVVSSALVQLTQQQALIWKTDLTLWAYVMSNTPDSIVGNMYFGHALFKAGIYDKAIEQYAKAIAITPLYVNLIEAYIRLGKLHEALAIGNYVLKHDINIGKSKDIIYYSIGWIYHQQGLLPEAQQALKQALAINPNHQFSQQLLSQIITNNAH